MPTLEEAQKLQAEGLEKYKVERIAKLLNKKLSIQSDVKKRLESIDEDIAELQKLDHVPVEEGSCSQWFTVPANFTDGFNYTVTAGTN